MREGGEGRRRRRGASCLRPPWHRFADASANAVMPTFLCSTPGRRLKRACIHAINGGAQAWTCAPPRLHAWLCAPPRLHAWTCAPSRSSHGCAPRRRKRLQCLSCFNALQPVVTATSPLFDPLCLAVLNTGIPFVGLPPVILTLTPRVWT
eukprot:357500-Chlamydomonas_euryale.AAC.15